MKLGKAIAYAVSIGGGRVMNESNICAGEVDPDGTWAGHAEEYYVHPLPPADFDFDEALECLKRGEKVVDDCGVEWCFARRYQSELHFKPAADVIIELIKNKRFRKA